jgi:glycosyltransferase involved in cell wall biosynthesis
MGVKLADWTVAQGVEVAISTRPGALDRYLPSGVSVLWRKRDSFPGLVSELATQTRKWKPDILHAHQRREALASRVTARLLRLHTVEHAHNEIPSRAFKSLSYRSEHVFAVSDSIRLMAISEFGVDPNRITVVDNIPVNVTDVAARHDLAPSPLRLLAVGRVDKQKDPHRFLRVVRAIARDRPVAATWIGDGPLLAEMRRATENVDGIVFVGQSFDVASALREAHALLVTSAWEGMPLIVLEALAAGTPVVTTGVGGLPSLIHDEQCGVVVDPSCPDDQFAVAVIRLLDDPAGTEAIRRRGWDVLRRRFHPDAAFSPILDTYFALK